MPPLIELGRIVNRHGIRGEVRVLPHNPASPMLEHCATMMLRTAGGACESRRVLSRRRHKQFLLVQFEGVDTANAAEALIGRVVCLDGAQLPPPGPGEIYHIDLIGCRVCTDDGAPVGMVRAVFNTGSNDVCTVEGDGREYLIPLIADVIVRIDVGDRHMVIRPIPGLLD